MKWNSSATAISPKRALTTAEPKSADATATPAVKKRTAAAWVKALVLWHVFCITVWACPKPSDGIMNGKVKPYGSDYLRYIPQQYLKYETYAPTWDQQLISMPIQCYLFTTGTWQYWDMFAPNPANMDWWGDAIVTYKDGSTKVYQYPRMALLPIPEKYLKERYRKFYERAHDDQYPYLFPPICQRIALLNYTDPKNPPVKVGLRRHWMFIADPGRPQAKDYSSYVYYTGVIDQRELARLARRAH